MDREEYWLFQRVSGMTLCAPKCDCFRFILPTAAIILTASYSPESCTTGLYQSALCRRPRKLVDQSYLPRSFAPCRRLMKEWNASTKCRTLSILASIPIRWQRNQHFEDMHDKELESSSSLLRLPLVGAILLVSGNVQEFSTSSLWHERHDNS